MALVVLLTVAVDDRPSSLAVLHRDGDLVVVGAKPGTATAPAGTGDGYALFREATLRHGYTIHLQRSPGVESLRPLLADAAATIRAETGLYLPIAAETTERPVGEEGAIDVVVSSSSVCGGSWLGCTSPAVYDGKVQRARIWINPRLFQRSAEVIDNTVRHELGHALGLAHYDARHDGEIQLMHSSRFDAPDFRTGDVAGLVRLRRGPTATARTAPATTAVSTTTTTTTTAPPPTVPPTTAPPTTAPPAPPTTAPAPPPTTAAPAPEPVPAPSPAPTAIEGTAAPTGAAELATLGPTAPTGRVVEGTAGGRHDGPVSLAVLLLAVNLGLALAVWARHS